MTTAESDEPCRCEGVEEFLRSDTSDEYAGVCVECELCGRQFDLEDVSEPRYREIRTLTAQKLKDAEKYRKTP